jgi:hypothetical protein
METLRHKFVESIPDHIEPGVIYISGSRRTAIHLCVCGCGHEVITPISPTDWQLKFDGESVSLSPSIGLWEFQCRSHYWIIKNQVRHSGSWDERQVQQGREREKQRRADFYEKEAVPVGKVSIATQQVEPPRPKGWLRSLLNFLGF